MMIPTLYSVCPSLFCFPGQPLQLSCCEEAKIWGLCLAPQMCQVFSLRWPCLAQSCSHKTNLCSCKVSCRINRLHPVKKGQSTVGWVPGTPHQLCTSSLFGSTPGEPLDVASVGDGEEHPGRSCPVLRRMSEDHSSQLLRPVSPAIDDAQSSSAAHVPQVSVGWGRTSYLSLAGGPNAFLAQHAALPLSRHHSARPPGHRSPLYGSLLLIGISRVIARQFPLLFAGGAHKPSLMGAAEASEM